MRENINICTVLVATTLLALCSVALYTRIQRLNIDHDFDILIFTQSWPKTICTEWKEKSASHTCSLPKKSDQWTIHGIWPTKIGTKGPNFCKRLPFDKSALASIASELNELWTDVELHPDNKREDLWKHEWQKHGSCAVALPSLDSELKFFKQALTWVKDYDLSKALSLSNIRPGKSYLPAEYSHAVEKAIGRKPFIECIHDPRTSLPYLEEIRLCFNKQLDLIDCDGISSLHHHVKHPKKGALTNCADDVHVVYPNKIPSSDESVPTPPPEEQSYYNLVNLYNSISFLKWFTS